ncbi:16S rRNA (guanine(966)-N(2))-methyltransferase RsmD [Kosmotoga pacifica]|uniref:16S rRNA (guanine(966)-N(2))-methyltransferase RsmD n=1 Tax=Kosmotoga pacifica TaxID=1330330 RepID=UPI00069C91F5|nr:16S rRNA (guanine(966)-N(2))-methyltransferase RsmD [Kosmotoga pacifica]
MLTITGGIYKGRKVETTPREVTRYTPQMARKAYFDILDVEEKSFLDLFSGSGVMGIEALSRGALKVTFVDSSIIACRTIKKNLRTLRASENNVEIFCRDFRRIIPRLEAEGRKYDLVFADPPFERAYFEQLLTNFTTHCVINTEGTVTIEAPGNAREIIEKKTRESKLRLDDIRKYGGIYLYFLKVRT